MEVREVMPALTAEEWERVLEVPGTYYEPVEYPHQAAALALYGQPFGFTHEDVEAVRAARDFCRARHMMGHPALDTVGDRIEALLPTKDAITKTLLNYGLDIGETT